MNSSYASGSLLYRSRDFGTARENRLCSDSTTRRPISSCTSNTFSMLEVMFLRIGDLLGHAIEEVHRDAPVCSHLLDVPLQDVADPQIAARVGRVGPGGVVKDCRCRNGSNILETPEHGNQSICKTQ